MSELLAVIPLCSVLTTLCTSGHKETLTDVWLLSAPWLEATGIQRVARRGDERGEQGGGSNEGAEEGATEWHFPSERVCVEGDKPAVAWLGQKLCDRDKSRGCLPSWDSTVAPSDTVKTEEADTHQGAWTWIYLAWNNYKWMDAYV